MKTMTKSEKVVNWAKNYKDRNIAHAKKELGYTDDKQFFFLLNRLHRQGRISFSVTGRTVCLGRTA